MRVTLWGTRGSLPIAGPDTVRYGGNTSCVEVRDSDDTVLILDAGTGIRGLGSSLPSDLREVHLLLTHLHMDHIQGLGFFQPLYEEDVQVHIWGPPSTHHDLESRLKRYLSPPLFPTRLRDLPCCTHFLDVTGGAFDVGPFRVTADLVCHPGPTMGYRIETGGVAMTYLPDHEPALGIPDFPDDPVWTSGFDLAHGVDLLIHDAQYSEIEYPDHVGWGHSSVEHTLSFATMAGVKRLVPFHHDPAHDDVTIDRMFDAATLGRELPFEIVPGKEGTSLVVE